MESERESGGDLFCVHHSADGVRLGSVALRRGVVSTDPHRSETRWRLFRVIRPRDF